jgi:hypothetical protein
LLCAGLFNNDQRAIPAKLFGIPQLKQEESQSAALVLLQKLSAKANLTAAVTAYN